jgi:hypothetical protein
LHQGIKSRIEASVVVVGCGAHAITGPLSISIDRPRNERGSGLSKRLVDA